MDLSLIYVYDKYPHTGLYSHCEPCEPLIHTKVRGKSHIFLGHVYIFNAQSRL